MNTYLKSQDCFKNHLDFSELNLTPIHNLLVVEFCGTYVSIILDQFI